VALLKGTTVYNNGPFFLAEGMALLIGTTVYNNGPFFLAEGVALLIGTTVLIRPRLQQRKMTITIYSSPFQ
jgi:hypothetical protein